MSVPNTPQAPVINTVETFADLGATGSPQGTPTGLIYLVLDTNTAYTWDGTRFRELGRWVYENLLLNGSQQSAMFAEAKAKAGESPLELLENPQPTADCWYYYRGGTDGNTDGGSVIGVEYNLNDSPMAGLRSTKYSVVTALPITDGPGGDNFNHNVNATVPARELSKIGDAGGCYLTFWVKSNHNATYSYTLINSGKSRSYIKEFTVTDSNEWERVDLFYPLTNAEIDGDAGWLNENSFEIGAAFRLLLGVRAGNSGISSNTDQFLAGSFLGTEVTDFAATAGNELRFAGRQVTAGVTPTPLPAIIPAAVNDNYVANYAYLFDYNATGGGAGRSLPSMFATGSSATIPMLAKQFALAGMDIYYVGDLSQIEMRNQSNSNLATAPFDLRPNVTEGQKGPVLAIDDSALSSGELVHVRLGATNYAAMYWDATPKL